MIICYFIRNLGAKVYKNWQVCKKKSHKFAFRPSFMPIFAENRIFDALKCKEAAANTCRGMLKIVDAVNFSIPRCVFLRKRL